MASLSGDSSSIFQNRLSSTPENYIEICFLRMKSPPRCDRLRVLRYHLCGAVPPRNARPINPVR